MNNQGARDELGCAFLLLLLSVLLLLGFPLCEELIGDQDGLPGPFEELGR
jgi:hypothetical protein